jgi:hypothetical protein
VPRAWFVVALVALALGCGAWLVVALLARQVLA